VVILPRIVSASPTTKAIAGMIVLGTFNALLITSVTPIVNKTNTPNEANSVKLIHLILTLIPEK